MIRLILYNPKEKENEWLQQAVYDKFAYYNEDDLVCLSFTALKAASNEILHNGSALIGWDVTAAEALRELEMVRYHYRDAFLLIIASSEISPLKFLTPAIRPDSLLLRPLEKNELQRAAIEMLQAVRQKTAGTEDCFLLSRREEHMRIPYSSIYYFEARDKKLYVRLHSQEFGFAGTIEQLEEQLPVNFCRTHRSFIVNTDKIDQVRLTENTVVLWDGIVVPLSRSYKRKVKELYHG